jgi:DNA repair ATPase RecN
VGSVGQVLEELGFPAGVFEVALGRRSAGDDEPAIELDGDAVAFDATGVDQVVYRLAPNPGEPARPLARIASGGELSRVALAIKSVWPRRTRRRSWSSTRSTRGSVAGARTRSGAICGRWPDVTRSCA